MAPEYPDRQLALGPLGNESHFSVTYIRTEYGYRNISLGAMLLFIIAREVQVNGGAHLYLQYPSIRFQKPWSFIVSLAFILLRKM